MLSSCGGHFKLILSGFFITSDIEVEAKSKGTLPDTSLTWCVSHFLQLWLPRNVHWINHQRYPPFQQLGPGVQFSKDPETLRAGKGFRSFEKRTPGH